MGTRPKRDPYGLVGATLDRYHIQELVGMGGTGLVYRAEHSVTGRVFAVKVLKPDLSNDADTSNLFIAEARKTRGLLHPHIVNILDAGVTEDGWTFLAMEWLEGVTLADQIKQVGPMSLERIAAVLDQVCSGVHHAHENGIIHRDLKPGNIMVGKAEHGEEVMKVLDFGVAKALSSTFSANSMVVGTSHYVPPEQWVYNSKIDRRADVYSLGVILYQLLAGKVPFDSDSYGQLMYQHLNDAPPPLRKARPDLSEAVEEVVLRAMAKNAEDRFLTAKELAMAFRQAISLAEGGIAIECVDEATATKIAGAAVYLNGRHVGQTNEQGQWYKSQLPPKNYAIEIDFLNYQNWQQSIAVTPSQELVVKARLARKPVGELLLNCGVADAEVILGGEKVGTTDERGRLYVPSLAVGNYSVKVVHPKYLPLETEAKIELGQQSFLNEPLQPRPQRQFGKKLARSLTSGLSVVTTSVKEMTGEIGGSVRRTSSHFPWKKLAQWSLVGLLVIGIGAAIVWATKYFSRTTIPSSAALTVQVYGLIPGTEPTPLADARVLVDGQENRTDTNGQLLLPNLTQKQISVQILKLGYEPVEAATVDLNTSQISKSFTLNLTVPEGMAFIQGGEYMMGRDNGDPEEKPAHRVSVKSFFIDKTEITNEQYKKFIDETRYEVPSSWKNRSFAIGEERFPVTNVTWDDANAYAKWAKKRLPTEEQWEYAARGKENRLYPWGNSFDAARANLFSSKLAPVGQLADGATPEGVMDLLGNAWEWTLSDYNPYSGGKNILEHTDYQGLPIKIIRGGACISGKDTPASLRGLHPATRNDWPSAILTKDRDYSKTGFRCIQELPN